MSGCPIISPSFTAQPSLRQRLKGPGPGLSLTHFLLSTFSLPFKPDYKAITILYLYHPESNQT